MSGRKLGLWYASVATLSLVLAVHFFFIFLYTLPLNPITAQYHTINKYVRPLFNQDWQLFAPKPLSTNDVVRVRGEYLVGVRTRVTPWVDISDSLISDVQKNRFSSQQIPELMVSNLENFIVSQSGVFNKGTKSSKNSAQYRPSFEYKILSRYSAAFLQNMYPTVHFDKIQLALTVSVPPNFLHYHFSNLKSKSESRVFPWIKTPEVV